VQKVSLVQKTKLNAVNQKQSANPSNAQCVMREIVASKN